MNANIAARLAEKAQQHPERPAIFEPTSWGTRSIAFGTLAERVAEAAAGLAARGVSPGDPVLLLLPISIQLYVALLAVHHAGAVAVAVDPGPGLSHLDARVAAAAPRAVIASSRARLLRWLSPALRAVPLWIVTERSDRRRTGLAGGLSPSTPRELEPDAPALITFTTGSTGRPKAMCRSHGFLWTQHEVLSRHLMMTPEDVDMPTLPVFVLNNLASGITTVLPAFDPRRPAAMRPERVMTQIVGHRVTTASGSPAFFERLLRWCERKNRRLPLRLLFTGGGPILPPLLELLEERIAGEAHVLYGSTEAEPISDIAVRALREAMRGPDAQGGGTCVGRPIPEIVLRLIRPCDEAIELGAAGWAALECASGEIGEVVVMGEHVSRAYWKDAEADRRNKIRDGERTWHRTGDGARLDREGRLWLMGRVSQRVRRAGNEWWSTAAEVRAMGIAGVEYAAYLGLPGGPMGERAALCVQGSGSGSPAPDSGALRAAVAPNPVDDIYDIDRIPRDSRHHSKTDVQALRALLAKRRPRSD